MALTFQEAYDATDPSASKDQREASANLLILGSRANDVYWDSRSELEALRARAEGHGVVVRAEDEEAPAAVGASGDEPVIEGTATEEPAALAAGDQSEADKLRAQLRNAGITPEV